MEEFNILVCDDDHSIVDAIEIYLKQEGYRVIKAYNGLEALKALEENEIHLIILDIMMPQLDGLQATVKIREICNIPILMLSAKSEDTDKVLGLNFGADDYITKPFNPVVLGAKVKAMIRRNKQSSSLSSSVAKAGPFQFDKTTLKLRKDGKEIPLSSKETMMISFFLEHIGQVFSKEQLYQQIWGDWEVDDNTIMVHINHLRNKIEDNPKTPQYIVTVWGLGYKFVI